MKRLNIGDGIKYYRNKAGLSQEELAHKLGYRSKSTIQKIEKGVNDIPFSKVHLFTDALGVSFSDLLNRNNDKCDSLLNAGQRIKSKRLALGYSAEQLADAIGVSTSTIYRYENNDISNMGVDKLKSIASFLCTDVNYIMGQCEDVKSNFTVFERIQDAMSYDSVVGDYKFSDDQLLEILEFARFKAGR